MKKTVLITGTSSGIGKSTAILFAERGWNVIATQRTPEKEQALTRFNNIRLMALDVTKPDTIRDAFENATREFGKIDVVVNNAGFGVDGVFEAMSDEVIEGQFNTNVFGLMRVTREAIQHMRTTGGGMIIQVSSMGGKITFPFYSIYHATKFAVEGFTESLHYELAPLNIQLKIVEPGLTATEFTGRSRQFIGTEKTNAYDEYLQKFSAAAIKAMKNAETPEKIAKGIFKAATDNRNRMRYPVGAPAPLILKLRSLLSDNLFFKMIKSTYKL
jgi:NAD(P)-dependent dehydrogenase (short-subunit alcohol dehydrogenase family)